MIMLKMSPLKPEKLKVTALAIQITREETSITTRSAQLQTRALKALKPVTGSKFRLWHLPALWPWVSYVKTQCFTFTTCEMGIIMTPTSWGAKD